MIPLAGLRGTAAAAGIALVALLAACTVGPSQRPPVAVRGEYVPAPAPVQSSAPATPPQLPIPEAQHATIPFVECTDDIYSTILAPRPTDRTLRIECGSIDVAADPDQPNQGTTSLTVMRVGLAGGSLDRPPLVVVGDTAVEGSARAAVFMAGQVPIELLDNYTLIGIDRRGSGSDPLDCAPSDARDTLVDADPTATDEATLNRLLDRARAVVQECNLTLDSGLGRFRTASTSGDLEVLRAALGVGRLSAIGTGDGAAAVAGWVRAAPQAAGRIVLDGPPQPGLEGADLIDGRAKATEAALDAFATACSSGPACPLGANPRESVSALVTALGSRPLPTADGRTLSAGSALLALQLGLSEPRTWPALAQALAAAANGQPTPLLDTLETVLGPRGRYDTILATACNDSTRRLAPAEISQVAGRLRTTYPVFGSWMALQLVECAPFPTGGAAPSATPTGGAPPMLVIGTAADPRSTLDGARRVADQTSGSGFVSWQGAGTGAYPRTPCVVGAVEAVLVGGQMPQASTLCPP